MEYLFIGPAKVNCSPHKKAVHASKGCLRLCVFLLYISGSTQQVILYPFDKATAECNDGSVVHGRDQVVMYGSVIADTTRPVFIDFYRQRVGGASSPVCGIDIAQNPCTPQSTALCYCQSKNVNNFTVVFNRTADEQDSNASLTLVYDGVPDGKTLPFVNRVEQVSVTVNGDASPVSLSAICNKNFLPGKVYNFTICARNLAGAEVYIGIDASAGTWKTTINNCSSFSNVEFPKTGDLTFAYREQAGCMRKDSKNCTISENDVSDQGCDTTCIIIIVVVVVVCGLVAVGAIYFYRRRHGKITTCVIIIKVSTTLIEVETMVIKKAERQGHRLPDCEKVIKYNGEKQDDKTIKLKNLVGVLEEVTVKVTVSVCRNGTFVLDEIVSVAVLDISVKANESLDQLQDMVKKDVSEQHPKAKLGILIFLLDGKEEVKSMKLGELFPGLKDGTKLTVIVHLDSQDGSHKCELKTPETTESSATSNSRRNNAVSDSRM